MQCDCKGCGTTYDDYNHSKICPHDEFIPNSYVAGQLAVDDPTQKEFWMRPKATLREHVRIVTKQAMWFDMDKPADFNMAAFVTSIRSVGFLLNDSIYQPAEGIATIFVWNEGAPPKDQGVVLPFPSAPA